MRASQQPSYRTIRSTNPTQTVDRVFSMVFFLLSIVYFPLFLRNFISPKKYSESDRIGSRG